MLKIEVRIFLVFKMKYKKSQKNILKYKKEEVREYERH